MPTTRVSPKHQITIPKEVFEALHLEVGDFLDVQTRGNKIILTPKKLIPKDQAWFWTKEWQEREREADGAIRARKVKEFKDVEELIKDLDS